VNSRTCLASLSLAGLALALLATGARAQNGSNYHVLNNGGDAPFVGIGAGGGQTAADGIGSFVAGEDLRGAVLTQLGDFGYRQAKFTEQACIFSQPPAGPLALRFPAIAFVELDGLNGHAPPVFTNPTCTQPSFPLGASGAVPYGTGPGSTASFVLAGWPSGLSGVSTAAPIVLPNNGLAPAGAGTATLVAAASGSLPIVSTGFCWAVTFTWQPSSLASLDDIDGWEHFLANSPDANQYWLISDNEENIWQSQTVVSDGGATALIGLPAHFDYAMVWQSVDPITVATLAPRAGTTNTSAWTANVSNEFGAVLNPNGGFDIGRGSAAISFSGTAGVANPNTGVGNQDPSLGPGITPSLGFATWDNGGDGDGSVRLTWVSVDFLCLAGGNPATDPGVTKQGGTVRVPVVTAGLLQPVTSLGFSLFGHVTRPGFINPLPPGGIGPTIIGGASHQLPIGTVTPPCVGLALNLTYGTSGRKGNLGSPGPLTFDQSLAATSGTRQLFLFE
jgi:hypothetical protein